MHYNAVGNILFEILHENIIKFYNYSIAQTYVTG